MDGTSLIDSTTSTANNWRLVPTGTTLVVVAVVSVLPVDWWY